MFEASSHLMSESISQLSPRPTPGEPIKRPFWPETSIDLSCVNFANEAQNVHHIIKSSAAAVLSISLLFILLSAYVS